MLATKQLVTLVGGTDKPVGKMAKVEAIQPEWMQAPRTLEPDFDRKKNEAAYLSFLERKIARDPRDLISHTQRVFLFHREKDKQACHDALLDLYLVLGARGYELRKNVLLKVKNSLQRPQREFFASFLKEGLTEADIKGVNTVALLSAGLQKGEALVSFDGVPENEKDLKEVAYALLEHDLVVESCRVWEKVLASDPGSSVATMELLSIYQHYQLKDDFFKTYMDLSGRKLALKELWVQLDKQFRKLHKRKRVTVQ